MSYSLEHLEAIREDREVPEVVFRRALHVVSEESRVLQAVECLRKGDFRQLGEQMTRSHASLQEDYEVRGEERGEGQTHRNVCVCLLLSACEDVKTTSNISPSPNVTESCFSVAGR